MSNTLNPVQQWSSPFSYSDTVPALPLGLMQVLAQAKGGFYPIGKNGMLHGGVHFDEATDPPLNQNEATDPPLNQNKVCAIADGEVIAWRLDTQNAFTEFENNTRYFSRNFVLLRHRLQAPAIDGADTPPELIFYSLYMHLKSWQPRQTGSDPLPLWQTQLLYRIKTNDQGLDSVLGLRVRTEPRGEVLGLLPRGCEVELQPLQAGETTNGWRRLKQITNGQMLPTPLPEGTEGWVFAGELDQISDPTNTYRVGTKAKDIEDGLLGGKGLNLRKTGQTKTIIGQIPQGVHFTLGKPVGSYCPITEFETGDGQPQLPSSYLGQSVHKDYVEALNPDPQPLALDTIHVPEQPIPIPAGDVVGYMGQYQNLNQDTSQSRLHLEVFTQDDLPEFIKQSRAWANQEHFPEEHQTLLKITTTSKIFPCTGRDRLPNATQAMPATASLLLNRQQLDRLPSTHRRWDSDNGACWWLLENCLPASTGDQTPTHYWIHETLSKLQPLTPWHWAGYTCLEEQRQPLEHLLSQLHHLLDTPLESLQYLLQSRSWLGATLSNALRNLPVGLGVNTLRQLFEHSHQLKHYLPKLDSAESSELQSHLLALLDKYKDGWLSPEEIGPAQQKAWQQQQLSNIGVKMESEWKWSVNKWKALDGLANHTRNRPNPNWAAQKERIEQLCWWKEVAAEHTELNTDGLIWTLHPGWLVSQMQKNSEFRFTREMLIASVPDSGWQLNNQDTEKLLNALNKYAGKYEVNTPLRAAHFLAQVAHESKDFRRRTEDTMYGVENPAVTSLLSSAPVEIKNAIIVEGEMYAKQPYFFNFKYGKRDDLENSDYYSGDGFKYRGRGYIQLTGRFNYRRANEHYLSFKGVDLGLLENPDKMNDDIDLSVELSLIYWKFMGPRGRDRNNLVDAGTDELSVRKVGASINGWYPEGNDPSMPRKPNGHKDRLKRFEAVCRLMGLKE